MHKSKIKIVFVIHSLNAGGAERVASMLANYWSGIGHQVSIITQTDVNNDFYYLSDVVVRKSINMDEESKSIVDAIYKNTKRLVLLRKILRRENPDIVIAMMTNSIVYAVIAGIGQAYPIIGSERNHPSSLPISRVWKILRRMTYPRLAGMVAQTSKIAEWLKKHAPNPEIRVIANPVKLPIPNINPIVEPRSIISNDKRILLAVGRLASQKAFDRLISAFSEIESRHLDWVLVIVGSGTLKVELEQLIDKYGLSHKVYLVGSVGNIGDWYSHADAYVMSSEFEGFPNTLLEAMAHGLPCISTDCDTGPSDLIDHGVNGLLVDNRSKDSLVAGLNKILDDKELRNRIGLAARDVNNLYSLESISSQWFGIIEAALNKATK